jgi:hypothetical protein
MLPGFRFLFAAIMLSMSLLIFGLGAAALLRAAHESFASNSSWRAAPEVPFAQHPDTTLPVLATLRVEPNAGWKASEQAPVSAAPVREEPAAAEPIKSDQVATLRAAETPLVEAAKPVELPTSMPAAENPPAAEIAPSPAASSPAVSTTEAAAAADERKITTAAVSDKSEPIKSEPAPAYAEPVSAPPTNQMIVTPETIPASAAAPAGSLAATKIATLGGPPVDVTDDASAVEIRLVKLPRARPDTSAIKTRVQARRATHRRRLALRARLMLQQQQVNPFGQPQSFPPAATVR